MTLLAPHHLLEGYQQFRDGRFSIEADRFRSLADGQSPRTMIIGCADSRVDPATIFAAGPGELFIVRNVAALVPPYERAGTYHGTSAAIEFAVKELEVSEVLVLGHGMCGGIDAALAQEHKSVGVFIDPWVSLLDSVKPNIDPNIAATDHDGRRQALEYLAVKHSIHNLKTFDFISDRIAAGNLSLHGAWFSIAVGMLYWLNAETGEFEVVDS
jgi:carbonic anhydrase